jgi:hypothetical protein
LVPSERSESGFSRAREISAARILENPRRRNHYTNVL